MAHEWIDARFKAFSERQRLEQIEQQRYAKLLDSSSSMFDALLMEVRDAVHHYNRLFTMECRATLTESANDFRVEVGKRSVQVLRNPGTVIIGIKRVEDGSASEDHLEVVMDKAGNLRYKHGANEQSVSDAVELVLDRVFCK
jgi:hypothetical protein